MGDFYLLLRLLLLPSFPTYIMAENLVNAFVTLVIENSDYEELDRIYLTNKVFVII